MKPKLLGIGLVVAVVACAGAVLAWSEARQDVDKLHDTADDRADQIDELQGEVEGLQTQSEADRGAATDVIDQAALAAEACEEAAFETLDFLQAALDAGAAVDPRHVDLADATVLACGDVRLALGDIPGG